MRYMIIFGAVVLLIAIVIASIPAESQDSPGTVVPRVIDGAAHESDAFVCCTFSVEGQTKTCAVMRGEPCDVCTSFCG